MRTVFKDRYDFARTWGFPDVSSDFPDVSKNLPDVSKNLPDVSRNFPDVSKNFPDVSKNFPDVSKNFPGYLFVKFSQTIFDQNHRICLSLKTFQNRVERTSVPEVCPCQSPCLRFSDKPVSEVMNLSESMSESDVLKNLVSESELEVKIFPGSVSSS